MSTLLRSAALVLCAGVSCAQATESAKQWEFNIGAMYEIENVEGQADDKDGLYEPPCGLMPLGMHGPFRWLCIRKGRLITVA